MLAKGGMAFGAATEGRNGGGRGTQERARRERRGAAQVARARTTSAILAVS
jgi:hypothetical protein